MAPDVTWAVGIIPALVLLLSLLFLLVFVTILIVRALAGRQDQVSLSREEAEQLRRMWQSMDRMEERIANLEALLLEKESEHRTSVSGESRKS